MTLPRATRLLTATAAASALALVPAGAANASTVKGLQDQDMLVNGHPSLVAPFFADAKSAKVGMTRFNVRWDGKSAIPDPSQVAQIKTAIQQGAAQGIRTVTVAPSLSSNDKANPRGKKAGPTAASLISSSAYTTYIRTLATQLKGLGAVVYYAPINEPNWYRFIPKRGGAALYRKLVNIAYKEVKSVDPTSKVLFGELLPYARAKSKNYPNGQSEDPGDFLRDVLGLTSSYKAKGSKATYSVKADGVSLHTYDFKADPRKKRKDHDQWTQANLSYAKSALKKAAKTGRISSKAASAVYVTEFAYKTTGSDKISTSKAKTYLSRAWSIAKSQKIRAMIWYQLRDPQSTGELWQSGLKTRTGGTRSTWTTFRSLK